MKTSKYAQAMSALLQKPIFRAAEARELGVSSRMLAYYCDQGAFSRLCRGVYRVDAVETGLDFSLEDLVLTAVSVPHGTICLISALCYYELTDQNMREYWIAVPNGERSPKRPHAKIIRMRNTALGRTDLILGGHVIKIFDRERTVCDAFRYLSHEIAIKALQNYLKPTHLHKPDLLKLSKYARILRVNLTPYLMALTT